MAESVHNRLQRLIDDILSEERDFEERTSQMQVDQKQLDSAHHTMCSSLDLLHHHERIRAAHEAMFKVHRKLLAQHRMAIQHCELLASRTRAGFLSEAEVRRETVHLMTVLEQMKRDHARIENERQVILAQHNDLVTNLRGTH